MDQIVTGSWSKKAAEEAAKYASVNIVAKGDNQSIPAARPVAPDARGGVRALLRQRDHPGLEGLCAEPAEAGTACFITYFMNLCRIA